MTEPAPLSPHGEPREPGELSRHGEGSSGTPAPTEAGEPGNLNPVRPDQTPPTHATEPTIERPGFRTHDDWFRLHGKRKPPGLYWHGHSNPKGNADPEPVDTWIATPIHAKALTANEHGREFGLLLRFLNPFGRWSEWAAPMALLAGSGEELRRELLSQGVRINPKAHALLTQWLMECHPTRQITAATRTGWHDGERGRAFVMPARTIGSDDVVFQAEHPAHEAYTSRGTLAAWRDSVAGPCIGNPVLLLAVSCAFAGPLLKVARLQETGGAGLHLVGDSSQGKTTALHAAASVWGGPDFVRTWRATGNGLEAAAAALNDALLVLDEISEAPAREIGSIVYALANGQGKQRAQRTGGAREAARWRIMALSSGERTLAAHMAEDHQATKAGQEVRLLDVPATNRAHGAFDALQGHDDARAFADALKQATGEAHGTAGPAFVEAILQDDRDLPGYYARCREASAFSAPGLEGRAGSIFALVGMAGELATDYGLTGWPEGEALEAATIAFAAWRDQRGEAPDEDGQICRAVRDFLDRHGDDRFSRKPEAGEAVEVRNRAGYWRDDPEGRVFLFNSGALQEAGAGFDLRRILDALDRAGWIADRNPGKRSLKAKVSGRVVTTYAIRPGGGE